jgi:O-antigen/teichoic acid export membrane protein
MILVVVTKPQLFGSDVARYQSYLMIAALSIPAMVLGGFANTVLASAARPRTASVLAVATAIVFALAAPIGIHVAGIAGFYWSGLIAGTAITATIIVYFKRKLHLPLWNRGATILQELRHYPNIIPFSFMLFLTAVSFSFSFVMARYAVLAHHGDAAAGLLHALLAIALSIGMVLTPINGVLLTPKMNRAIAKEEKLRSVIQFQKILVLVLSATALPFVLFPQTGLTVLFSSEFAVVGRHLYLFVFAQCVVQLAGVYTALLIGLNDMKAFTAFSLIGHLSFALLSWLLAPTYGILGVGIGFAVSALSLCVLAFWRLSAKHGFRVPANLGWLTLYGILAMLVLGAVSGEWENQTAVQIAGKGLVYLGFLGSLLLFLKDDDRIRLLAILNAALGKRRKGRGAL